MSYTLSDNTWDNLEHEAIRRVMDSGFYSMGKEVRAYEKEFARKMGAKYAVMSNSGSSANLLAIAALVYSGKLKSGDEVIVPAVSWSTTFFPLAQFNLKLKFIDIDLNTLNMDINILENAITDCTKAVFCVNLLGNPNDFNRIQQICKEHNLILIEDNCEALGGGITGKKLGTFGILGTYSTFYSHHLCTMEGGVTVTDDEELYHYLLCIRSHGWTRNLPKDSLLYQKNEDEFYETFQFIMPGYNLRPLEIEAAIGIVQLKKMSNIIESRRKNAEFFIKRMSGLHNYLYQQETGNSSWFGFSVVLINQLKGKRDNLIKILRQNEIEVRPIVAGNFTKSPAVRYLNYEIFGELKNADYIHENGFFVGNHSKDITSSIDGFLVILKEFEKNEGF